MTIRQWGCLQQTDFTEDLKQIDVPTLVMHDKNGYLNRLDSTEKSTGLTKGAKERVGSRHAIKALDSLC